MAAPILVTGGTGTLGSLVVPRLRNSGRDVRVLSRRGREGETGIEYVAGDVATGAGLDAAIEGTETILHLAGSAKGDEEKARHLVEAASRAGVRHLVYISVVGADKIPMASPIVRMMFGYFGAKYAAERIVAGSGVPWTTLRSTQFQDLLFKTVQQMAKLPIIPAPSGFRFQPIDPADVASRLVDLALAPPSGLAPEIGGPRVYTMADLIRGYLRASGKRRLVLPVPLPGQAARAFREGANLAPDRAVGQRTWEEFLAARLGATSERRFVPAS